MKASVDELPFQLAIRLILDDVANSNALPDWLHPVYVDYSAREVLLRKQAHLYLAGDYAKRASFSILVPKKSGEKKLWFLPSVNDQMLLQACVSSFAVQLDNQLEDQSVYSYRLNRELDRVALVADQVSAWAAFQAETHKRCADQDCLLQFDLRDAFGSIDRSRVYRGLAAMPVKGASR